MRLSLWSGRYLGKGVGFLTSWCYLLNNIPYVPSVLLYMVATIAFISPQLQNSSPHWHWILTVLLVWGLVALSRIGFGAGGWIRWCAYSTFLIIIGVVVMGFRHGVRPVSHANSVPGGGWAIPALNLETTAVFGFICMSM